MCLTEIYLDLAGISTIITKPKLYIIFKIYCRAISDKIDWIL